MPIHEIAAGAWTEGPLGLSVHGHGAGKAVLGTNDGVIGRFDGAAWGYETVNFGFNNNKHVCRVFAAGPDELYAFGVGAFGATTLARFDGTSWALNNLGDHDKGLYSPGGGVVYAGDTDVIWRIEGAQIDPIYLPGVRSIHGVDAQHVYACGNLHVHEISTGTPIQIGGATPFSCGPIWAAAPDEVYVVNFEGQFLRVSASSVTFLDAPPTDLTLHALWGTSPTQLFAAGNGGAVLRYEPD